MPKYSGAAEYGGFSQRIVTACGIPLLAGGLCSPGYERQSLRDLSKLSQLDFSKKGDIYETDSRLAEAVRQCCGHYVLAVGVSAALSDTVFDTGFNTGGIIGSPRDEIKDADTNTRYIGNGLYLRAFAGGPGCVAAVKRGVIEGWEYELYPPDKKADSLARYLQSHGAAAFIVVSDGTGEAANGSVILEIYGERTVLSFDARALMKSGKIDTNSEEYLLNG